MSKVVGDVISDNFCLKKIPEKPPKMEEGQKMKILALEANSTKCYIHNLWATRRLEMQKLGAVWCVGGEGQADLAASIYIIHITNTNMYAAVKTNY